MVLLRQTDIEVTIQVREGLGWQVAPLPEQTSHTLTLNNLVN
jgi:hypothetical protein